MRKQKGFSLIELLIVVAIILIIAAIAIPNLLRSRMAANEASAVGSLRTVNTAEVTYASVYPAYGFTDLKFLGQGDVAVGSPAAYNGAQLLDSVLGCAAGTNGGTCTKSGYDISPTVTVGDGTTPTGTYSLEASPHVANQTGTRSFYTDASGVIRYNAGGQSATSASDPLQ